MFPQLPICFLQIIGRLTPIPIESLNFMNLTTNTVLTSNNKYLSTVTGLTHTLPSTPSVGDVIEIATGNFDTIVLHGNGTQTILNLSTMTQASAELGIVLKPYSVVQLVYIATDLWITSYRSRTINNLTYNLSLESELLYSVAEDTAYSYDGGYDYTKINDGIVADGVRKTGGGVAGAFGITVTLVSPRVLTAYGAYGGLSNTDTTGTPDSFDIYDNTNSYILETGKPFDPSSYSIIASGGVGITNTLLLPSTSYDLTFYNSGGDPINIAELVLIGKTRYVTETTAI